jgi:hypothetical protein
MKYLKANYRGIAELLELMPPLMELLGLEQVPHFTTINKFFLRIGTNSANALFVGTVCWFDINGTIIAIDSTGYSSEHASKYYALRIHGDLWKRHYVKLSIAVCSESQCIVASYARLGPRNDNIDFPWLVEQSAMLAKPAYIVADRGYDSEANHRLVRALGSKPMIPLRSSHGYNTTGSFRKKMLRHFNDDIYHRREPVESVNSVMKRLLGSSVQSRSLAPQCVEVTLMCMIYNAYRKTVIGFHVWFLHGRMG